MEDRGLVVGKRCGNSQVWLSNKAEGEEVGVGDCFDDFEGR